MAKLRKNEGNAKGKLVFLFISECIVSSAKPKLRKKLVKNNGFWRINAIRPKIKVKRGKMRKYENEGNAKLGGLVKELGFLFVTQIQVSEES